MSYIYNFPISMLRGFMTNTDSVLDDILCFCIWLDYEACEQDIEAVKERLHITIGNEKNSLKKGKELSNRYRNDGYPWTGISNKLFWDYMRKGRSDFDKATLLAFLAIKSLIGQKPYYKVTNQSVIFKRMAGYKESEKFIIPKEITKFTTRSRFDRIKLELKEKWNVVIYANHVRGMYISTTLSLEELAMQAEKNKLRTRQRAQSHEAEEARRKAVEILAAEYPKPQPTPRTEQPHQVQKPPQLYYDNGNDLDF